MTGIAGMCVMNTISLVTHTIYSLSMPVIGLCAAAVHVSADPGLQ